MVMQQNLPCKIHCVLSSGSLKTKVRRPFDSFTSAPRTAIIFMAIFIFLTILSRTLFLADVRFLLSALMNDIDIRLRRTLSRIMGATRGLSLVGSSPAGGCLARVTRSFQVSKVRPYHCQTVSGLSSSAIGYALIPNALDLN